MSEARGSYSLLDGLTMYNNFLVGSFFLLDPPVSICCTNQCQVVPGLGDTLSPYWAWYHDGSLNLMAKRLICLC